MTAVIDRPGVYVDLDHADYIADPVPGGSLSASGVRRILDAPAKFRQWADEPGESTPAQTLGTAAHRTVLGIGPKIHVTSQQEWRTDAVKAEVKAARERGELPLRPKDADTVLAMAERLKADGLAGRVFDLEHGTPEPSLFWSTYVDIGDGSPVETWRRCRLDWLNTARPGRRLIVPDYKTTEDASPDAFARSMWTYGYHIQAQYQADAVVALGLAGDQPPASVFVVQETSPPYVVSVFQPDEVALLWARRQIAKALQLFARCTAEQRWPDYSDGQVLPVGLPGWALRDLDDQVDAGRLEALP